MCEQKTILDTTNGENLIDCDMNEDAARVSNKYAQYYRIVSNSQDPDDAVGRPLVHKSAVQQTTGK